MRKLFRLESWSAIRTIDSHFDLSQSASIAAVTRLIWGCFAEVSKELSALVSLWAVSIIAGSNEHFGDLEPAAQDWFGFAIRFNTVENKHETEHIQRPWGQTLPTPWVNKHQKQASTARDANNEQPNSPQSS